MACAPHYCNYHNTGTTTCVGHRPSCATNRPLSVSGDYATVGGRVYASDVDNLRTNIRDELAAWDVRYGPYIYYQAVAYLAGITNIDNVHPNELDEMIDQVVGGGVTIQGDNTDIEAADFLNLKNRYDIMRTNCICNADCSCNYVCVCHGDCGCHYSDERLKQEIQYC